jgi:hypothetical protein
VYNHLYKIRNPILYMHGKDDDICPASQSFIAYNVTLQTVYMRQPAYGAIDTCPLFNDAIVLLECLTQTLAHCKASFQIACTKAVLAR